VPGYRRSMTNPATVTAAARAESADTEQIRHRPARIAVQIAPQHTDYPSIRRSCAQLEELGVDVLLNWDHFFPLAGDPAGAHFECWTVLAAWAEATERIEIGPLVSCNAYRNPQLLADMARTVDHISGGRLILGIGSGWAERDFLEYGYPFGTDGSRLDALSRDLPTIERRWASLNPPPVRPIPVLIGGGGERKTLRLVARHATIWHGYGDPATIAGKHRVLDQRCAEIGRDPQEIERSAGVAFRPGREIERVADYAANAQQLYDVGSRLITTGLQLPPYDFGKVRDLLSWRDQVNSEGQPSPTCSA